MRLVVLALLPFIVAGAFALAAALHYGAAAMRDAPDLPNLPMAMLGGAIAGGLAVLLAYASVQFLQAPTACLPPGVIIAGLAGEYLAGRADDVRSALIRGSLCAVTLFPVGATIMALLLRQVS